MRLNLFILAITASLLTAGAPANAETLTLKDQLRTGVQSSLCIDLSQPALTNWTVAGRGFDINQTYRTFVNGNEVQWTLAAAYTSDANFDTLNERARLNYTAPGLTLAIVMILSGGDQKSALGTQITLTNSSGGAVDVTFVQNSVFDLSRQGADTAEILSSNTLRQAFGGTELLTSFVKTTGTLSVSVDDVPMTGAKSKAASFADGSIFGPGNIAWSVTWQQTLANNDTTGFSIEQHLTAVPAPDGAALLLMGLCGTWCIRRRSAGPGVMLRI